ncbi:MAG TPA: anti-sigma factor antagonist [Desulfobulbus sp.]|nr:anti-sigma factor antagonist [Desulfobulbus sp.]
MESSYYEEAGHLIVKVSGKLDTINAPKFGKILEKLLAEKPISCLLDFSEIVFLSSSGLQVLLAGAKISRQEGITFGVFGMREMVEDVFKLSGFNQFIRHFADKNEALNQQ